MLPTINSLCSHHCILTNPCGKYCFHPTAAMKTWCKQVRKYDPKSAGWCTQHLHLAAKLSGSRAWVMNPGIVMVGALVKDWTLLGSYD